MFKIVPLSRSVNRHANKTRGTLKNDNPTGIESKKKGAVVKGKAAMEGI